MITRYEKEVLVSGNGIGSLYFVYKCLEYGLSVHVIANHKNDFLRMQHVYLFKDIREQLANLLSNENPEFIDEKDKKFIHALNHNTAIAIKDIEWYLKRRVDVLNQKINLATFDYQSIIKSVSLEKGLAEIDHMQHSSNQVNTSTLIKFNYLIGADGARHHAANKINEAKQGTITYTPLLNPEYKYHGSLYLQIENETKTYFDIPKNDYYLMLLDSEYEKSKFFSFLSFDTASHKKSNGRVMKCHFVGEIPFSLYQLIKKNDENKATQFIQFVNQAVYQAFYDSNINTESLKTSVVKNSQKHGLEKDKLKITFFKTNTMRASTPSIKNENNYFCNLGDAEQSSNYQLGHGANNALFTARKAAKMLLHKDVNKYNAWCNIRSVTYTNDMSFFKTVSKERMLQIMKGVRDKSMDQIRGNIYSSLLNK